MVIPLVVLAVWVVLIVGGEIAPRRPSLATRTVGLLVLLGVGAVVWAFSWVACGGWFGPP